MNNFSVGPPLYYAEYIIKRAGCLLRKLFFKSTIIQLDLSRLHQGCIPIYKSKWLNCSPFIKQRKILLCLLYWIRGEMLFVWSIKNTRKWRESFMRRIKGKDGRRKWQFENRLLSETLLSDSGNNTSSTAINRMFFESRNS